MKKTRWFTVSIVFILSALLILATAFASIAANYPERTITMIIPFDPGTSSDRCGRMIAGLAEKTLGVKLSIVNKPGSAGAVGYTLLRNSKPNGYTISFGTSTLVTHKILGNLDFDYNDISPIIIFQFDPVVLSVNSKSKYKKVSDLVAEAKSKPGKITQATGAPGGILNVASLGFEDVVGVKFRLIPSGGGGAKPAVQLGGGHVDSAASSVGEAAPQVDAKNIRVLGVMAESKVSRWPDIPTMKEQGIDFSMGLYRGIIAPKGTPKERLQVLHKAFKKASESAEYKKFLKVMGATSTYAGLEKCKAVLKKQGEIFKKVLK